MTDSGIPKLGEVVNTVLPSDYPSFLENLKARIRQARTHAALAVNRELVLLYWQIGKAILERQSQLGWGAKVIEQLGQDLRREFPEMKGLSSRNLKYMRAFADAWPDAAFVQQAAAHIPWFHNCLVLDKLKTPAEREWYIRACIQHGWSRNVLAMQIDSSLYERQGAAHTNFSTALPAPQSELAQQLLKDPYNFDFLSLGQEALERDLERGLIGHIRDFLLELGHGFAFVANQYHLEVGDEDFYVDLLMYHLKLHCYVVIDLKMGAFRPEHAGKLNFYVSAVDDLVRGARDDPTIGILLCRDRNKSVAEYALRGMRQPLSVSRFDLAEALPAELEGVLPSIAELEAELEKLEPNG